MRENRQARFSHLKPLFGEVLNIDTDRPTAFDPSTKVI
jgi:hypothetical protein